jgi:hypothetical protein
LTEKFDTLNRSTISGCRTKFPTSLSIFLEINIKLFWQTFTCVELFRPMRHTFLHLSYKSTCKASFEIFVYGNYIVYGNINRVLYTLRYFVNIKVSQILLSDIYWPTWLNGTRFILLPIQEKFHGKPIQLLKHFQKTFYEFLSRALVYAEVQFRKVWKKRNYTFCQIYYLEPVPFNPMWLAVWNLDTGSNCLRKVHCYIKLFATKLLYILFRCLQKNVLIPRYTLNRSIKKEE